MSTDALLSVAVAFFASLTLTSLLARVMKRVGITGVDVHKLAKPRLPEQCGVAIGLSLILAHALMLFQGIINVPLFLTYAGTITLAVAIGFLDRWANLTGVEKPLLSLSLGLPPLIFEEVYRPYLEFPLGYEARLAVVYPILIPIALAVTSNAVNMLDVLNGAMAGSSALVGLFIAVAGALLARPHAVYLSLALVASLVGFLVFNKYPARVFAGDSGSLAVGAFIGLLAITEKLEFVTVVAMLPFIMNSFLILGSIGGFVEHKELPRRPTQLTESGLIRSTPDPRAPITLVRLLVSGLPKSEPQIVKELLALFVISGALSLVTAFLMR